MTKVPSEYKYQKPFWVLSGVCLSLALLYVGLVGKTVANTLERQNAENEISDVGAKVSQLDFAYLNLKSSINADTAKSLGFLEASKTLVARKGAGLSISMKNEI